VQSDWLQATRRGLRAVIRVVNWIAGVALVVILLILVANVFGRYVIVKPLQGTLEIVAVSLIVLVFFAMARTEVDKAHISVTVVVEHFPRRAGSILLSIMYFLGAVYLIVLGWRAGVLGVSSLFPRIKETDVLNIPLAPFLFVMALGVVLLSLEMLLDCFQPLPPEGDKRDEAK